MNKILYFTIEKEREDEDGWKKVLVYDIQDNVPKRILDLTIELHDNSAIEIKIALVDDLGWSNEEAKECILILL